MGLPDRPNEAEKCGKVPAGVWIWSENMLFHQIQKIVSA